ncbi:unnamed protein product [Cylicocyclus nassatus]|uniref:Uncharacterized protein n=1 Tax=Cylicocyclus nassatus TaxID=53992 RepID=A0AA36HGT7_CYLNA|nr:unnamed protein product [Cylicocyclus nassatus]
MAYCFLIERPFAFLYVLHPVSEAFVHRGTMDRARPRNQTEDRPPTCFDKNLAGISQQITLREAAAASLAKMMLTRSSETLKKATKKNTKMRKGKISGVANEPKQERPVSNSSNIMIAATAVPTKCVKPRLIPLSEVRYDSVGHWPIPEDGNKQRCKLESCGGRSRIQCEKCNVRLCPTKHRNCFKTYPL